jgi:uncharacterized protein YbjQ (UPF0145 family)
MLVVTTECVAGYRVHMVLGEVHGLTIRSRNAFKEGLAKLTGGADPLALAHLAQWRGEALAELVREAARRGANGVIGMRWDHRDLTAMATELCAYGTAVLLIPDATIGVQRTVAVPAPTPPRSGS